MILTFHVPLLVIAYVKIWQSVKFPALDEVDHLNTLEEFGGAILPSQVDLDRLMAKKSRFGEGAPKVRLVVGSHYGRNSDGSSKPIRSFLEEWVIFDDFGRNSFPIRISTEIEKIFRPIRNDFIKRLLSMWLADMLRETQNSLRRCCWMSTGSGCIFSSLFVTPFISKVSPG